MTQRKAFNFYASYWEQIKLLNDRQKLEIFTAICSVQFLEVNINDIKFKDKLCTLVWAGINHSIKSSINGFISKHKSLDTQIIEPLSKGGSDAPCQQEEEKEEVKEKEEGKRRFKPPLLKDVIIYFSENGYTPKSAEKAFRYYDIADWHDSKGNKIKNWKQKMNGVWFKEENIDKSKKPKTRNTIVA